MTKRPNLFTFERLEDRRLMTNNITAVLKDGTLTLTEAFNSQGHNQAVEVSGISGGVRVKGLDSFEGGISLVNGKSFVDFKAKNLFITLGGGFERVIVDGVSLNKLILDTAGPGANDNDLMRVSNSHFADKLDITTGDGADHVTVENVVVGNGAADKGNLAINTGVRAPAFDGDDVDEVFIGGTTVRGTTKISTGANEDHLFIRSANLGDASVDPVTIETGAGADLVVLGSSPNTATPVGVAANLTVITGADSENDVDTVVMEDVFVDRNIVMQFGGGDDKLTMTNIQAKLDISLNGMTGNDTMKLTQVEAFNSFFALLGVGSDTLDITFVKAKKVQLDGGDGDGYDKLFLQQSPNIPTLIETGFEEINGKKLIKKGILDNAINTTFMPL